MCDGLQRGAGFEHAAAAGAEHVPGEIEEAEPGGMQERRDGALLAEPDLGGEARALIRHKCRSLPSRITDLMAATTA